MFELKTRNLPKTAKFYVAGHAGMVGSALVRRLKAEGFTNLLLAEREDLDLRDQAAVKKWFQANEPDYVFMAAARVGGILANQSYPADFIYDNLAIELNVMHAAYLSRVERLQFLGSSCIYPRECPQPIKEEYLLTSALEKTNEAYAIAKIAGMKLCEYYRRQYDCDFISCMPTNLYGPYDNFDIKSSHVLPALIRKFHEAKMLGGESVSVWGSGEPRREFLHVDDLAEACIFLMDRYDPARLAVEHVNIGTGEDLSIRELAETIRQVVFPDAHITWDSSKPDGTPRKLLDVSRLHSLGWRHRIGLREGIENTYSWFKANWRDPDLR